LNSRREPERTLQENYSPAIPAGTFR